MKKDFNLKDYMIRMSIIVIAVITYGNLYARSYVNENTILLVLAYVFLAFAISYIIYLTIKLGEFEKKEENK